MPHSHTSNGIFQLRFYKKTNLIQHLIDFANHSSRAFKEHPYAHQNFIRTKCFSDKESPERKPTNLRTTIFRVWRQSHPANFCSGNLGLHIALKSSAP